MNEYDRGMIITLRNHLVDIPSEFTDFDLLRWLQGHNYNVDVIVPKLRHHFRFLRSFDFTKRLDGYDLMDKYWMFGLLGNTGKDNNFVYIETLGTLDAEGLVKSLPIFIIGCHRFYVTETKILKAIREREAETGRQSGIVFFQDLEGGRLNPKVLSLLLGPFKHLLLELTDHYAEIVQKYVVINAPPVFSFFYNLIQPALPEKTKQKLVVLGSDWKTEILKHANADALPVHWGGNLVDENGDPKCSSKVVITSKVPEHFYQPSSMVDSNEFTVLRVPAGRFEFVNVKISNLGTVLEFHYFSDSDWGIGVFFTENENETDTKVMEMVFPHCYRIGGDTVLMEKGRIECKKQGYYKIWFNNSFSWFRTLNIKYKIITFDPNHG